MIQELTVSQIERLLRHVGVRYAVIKENFKDILKEANPGEYTEKDDVFFNKYAGKKVIVYPWSKYSDDKDWFILEDDNYPITKECFKTEMI